MKIFKSLLLSLALASSFISLPSTASADACDNNEECNFTATCFLNVYDHDTYVDVGWEVTFSPRTTDYDYTYGSVSLSGQQSGNLDSNSGDGNAAGSFTLQKSRYESGSYSIHLDGHIEAYGGQYTADCSSTGSFTVSTPDPVLGCTDPDAYDYNPNATQYQAGSCHYHVTGCMDPNANNYNPSADVSGSCTYDVYGCNDPGALNYDPSVTIYQPGSCIWPSYTLTASVASGSGTISATGISCPGDCSETFQQGEWVTLTATASSGYAFSSWSGACSGQGASCSIQMDQDRTTSATFTSSNRTLTVAKSGSGSGTVTSSPSGVSCGSTCSATYSNGTSVTLTATPGSNSNFAGWSGACTGTGTCSLTMSADKSVTATFSIFSDVIDPSFNYSLSNSGTSNVTKTSGSAYTQNTITKTLTGGSTQGVSLALSGVPSGVSYSISNQNCSPTCTSVITFTVTSSAPAGNHTITVTGTPLNKTTSFTLAITGASFSASCSVNPSTATLGQSVTWSSSVTGGVAPLTYSWSGTGFPTSATSSSVTRGYSTIGQKTGQVTVTDADSVQATCPAVSTFINFDPNFEEF